jgi:thiol-disulfide isomerase/thioredoxin
MKLYHLKTIAILLFAVITFQCTYAQSNASAINQLNIGDQCPNFQFAHLINYSKKSARLSDFKGKLVIIDFWATWCGSCYRAMPHLSGLQKKYGDKLIVIAATYEDSLTVFPMLKKNRILKATSFPILYSDKALPKYFIHKQIPHTVVIDQQGIVKAITSPEELSDDKVKAMISHESVALKYKKDLMHFDSSKPLLFGAMGNDLPLSANSLVSNSILMKYNDGIGNRTQWPFVLGEIAKISCSGPIVQLYRTALATHQLPNTMMFNPEFPLLMQYSRIIWEAKDSLLFNGLSNDKKHLLKTDTSKCWYYELVLPRKDSLKLNSFMLQDLNRYFGMMYGLEGLKEKRKVQCWALVRSTPDKFTTDNEKWVFKADTDTHQMNVRKCKTRDFLFWWYSKWRSYEPIPIVNEADENDLMNFDLDVSPTATMEVIADKLKHYGFTFKKVERDLNMIVIRDVKQ